jgi:hypothetical protein
METLKLTKQGILNDIEGYQERLKKAQQQLDALPVKSSSPRDQNNRAQAGGRGGPGSWLDSFGLRGLSRQASP